MCRNQNPTGRVDTAELACSGPRKSNDETAKVMQGRTAFVDRAKLKSRNILWPLQVLLVASLLGPALFFAYTGWSDYRRIERQTEERIDRALDVIQEHTLKAFQTIERTI